MKNQSAVSQFSASRWAFLKQRLDDRSRCLHVVGLGAFGGNLALVKYLLSCGHRIELWEKKGPDDLAESRQALGDWGDQLSIHWHSEPQLPKDDLIFLTPAMTPSHASLREISPDHLSTEIELALAIAADKKVVIHAITGSVGKSTSACLMAQALDCEVYGNIGRSLLSEPEPWPRELVLEISSYQLHYLQFSQWCPSSGLMTPLRDHHAAWHGSVAAYQNCKLDAMNSWAKSVPCTWAEELRSTGAELSISSDELKALWQGRTLNLLGQHNQQNALAVSQHCAIMGRLDKAALERMEAFPGLPHRLELCLKSGPYRCINDSKATSPGAVIQALHSVDMGCWLILQGVPTGDPVEMLELAQARCARVIFIGGMQAIQSRITWNRLKPEIWADLESFFQSCSALQADLLFSPGGPSYDQYLNYEKRGEHFSQLCRDVLGSTGAVAASFS